MRVVVPHPAILAGAVALPAYWIALAAGVESPLVTHWAYIALTAVPIPIVVARVVRVRAQRFAWGVLAAGLTLWTLGSTWQVLGDLYGVEVPSPGPVDLMWLTLYPCVLVTFIALGRPWLRRAGLALGLDTLTVMFVTAGLVTAAILPRLLTNDGQLTGFSQFVFSAYPVADSVLMSVALVGAAVAGRRAGAVWRLLAAGTVALVVGDTFWTLSAAAGTWQPVMDSNAIFPLWTALVAVAAWQPVPERGAASAAGVRTHAAVLVAVLVAIALLVANEWVDVPAVSVVLVAIGLCGAVHRTALSLAASLRASLAASRERELVDEVRDALEHGDLDLHFQPLVDLRSGRVHGAEALLRWDRMRPDQFLPAVERSALMAPLTDFVLDRALAAAASWRAAGDELGVSVNLATSNLVEYDLPARVLAALRRHGVPAHALTLEITETAALADSLMADEVVARLEEAGIALSIDDFGTGHSSLGRIARFPIREVKIDRSFVREMHRAKLPIVKTTIELAHALGLRVVAEGIEDAETLESLRALGCDVAQGYHLSRPLAPAAFSDWLKSSNRTLIGVTDLSEEERDLCWKSRDSQSGSAASPHCTKPPSTSPTGASAG